MTKIISINSDYLGIITNSICTIHCLATPFLFMSQVQIVNTDSAIPIFWNSLNYLFIIISFFAIRSSSKKSSKKIVKILLHCFWVLLSVFIINEQFEISHIPEFFTYSSALVLCALHIYNMKYCKCKDENCWVQK